MTQGLIEGFRRLVHISSKLSAAQVDLSPPCPPSRTFYASPHIFAALPEWAKAGTRLHTDTVSVFTRDAGPSSVCCARMWCVRLAGETALVKANKRTTPHQRRVRRRRGQQRVRKACFEPCSWR